MAQGDREMRAVRVGGVTLHAREDGPGDAPARRFELIRGAGHLPPVEQPEALGSLITQFLEETGHV
jgi:3-oxoadipate enol-lactonase